MFVRGISELVVAVAVSQEFEWVLSTQQPSGVASVTRLRLLISGAVLIQALWQSIGGRGAGSALV